MQDGQGATHGPGVTFRDRAVAQECRGVVRAETEEFGKKFEHPVLDRIAPEEFGSSRGRCICLRCHGPHYFEPVEKDKAARPAANESFLNGNG